MLGSIIKNYFCKKNNIDKPIVVALVPCTAKKYEVTLTDDVDYAITVREFVKWVREEKINFRKIFWKRKRYSTIFKCRNNRYKTYGKSICKKL